MEEGRFSVGLREVSKPNDRTTAASKKEEKLLIHFLTTQYTHPANSRRTCTKRTRISQQASNKRVNTATIRMSSTTTYRPYHRSSSGSSSENLPPRTLARVAREIRDLHKNPPEGVRLVVDGASGVPSSLGEVVVSN